MNHDQKSTAWRDKELANPNCVLRDQRPLVPLGIWDDLDGRHWCDRALSLGRVDDVDQSPLGEKVRYGVSASEVVFGQRRWSAIDQEHLLEVHDRVLPSLVQNATSLEQGIALCRGDTDSRQCFFDDKKVIASG